MTRALTPADVLVDDSATAVVRDLGAALTELTLQGRYFGQYTLSVVLYDRDERILGGGWIRRALRPHLPHRLERLDQVLLEAEKVAHLRRLRHWREQSHCGEIDADAGVDRAILDEGARLVERRVTPFDDCKHAVEVWRRLPVA